jgi:hypothetical protein
MKKACWVFVSLVSMAGAAWAQNAPLEGISESTDQAKVSDVERRAQEIASRQQTPTSGASAGSAGAASSGESMPGKARKGKGKTRHGVSHGSAAGDASSGR